MNLLMNPGFEAPAAAPLTTLTGNPQGGACVSPSWTTWNNSPGTTTTDLLPSTRPHGARHMLHVCTTSAANGIVQVFLSDPQGPRHVMSSVWVFVVRGQVGMGTGHGGNTVIDAKSTTTGKWEELRAPNGVSPATEFIVYSVSPEGACYYVDNATIVTTR